LQECWRTAQRWLTFISTAIILALSGEQRFELRGVIMPLALFCNSRRRRRRRRRKRRRRRRCRQSEGGGGL
jgi:hypothetical protein